MTLEFGGRLYPAKDAAMTASQFQSFYPQWEQFARYRDPHAHLQLLGARYRRQAKLMSTTQQTTDRPIQTPRKILVLGATSGIAEATCRIWGGAGCKSLSGRAQCRKNLLPSPPIFAPAAPVTLTRRSQTSTTRTSTQNCSLMP